MYSSRTEFTFFSVTLSDVFFHTSQPMSCAMAFGILMIVMLLNLVLNRLTKGEFSI